PARVELWGGDPYTERTSFSTANSAAGFGAIPDSDYWIQAWPLSNQVPQLANSIARPISAGGAGTDTFRLTLRTPNVVGQVVSPEGNSLAPAVPRNTNTTSVAPAHVSIRNQDWSVELQATTNISGEFGLALPRDDYELIAHPNYHPDNDDSYTKSMPVNFSAPGPNAGTNLQLDPVKLTYPRLIGYVLDPQGKRVSTNVLIEKSDLSYEDFSFTEALGNNDVPFRFGGMPDGNYEIQADPPWHNPDGYGSSIPEMFVVQPDSQYDPAHTEHISLTLGIPNFIGEIYFPDDNGCFECPVPHVDVKLEIEGGGFEARASTGYDGKFSFSGLPAGDFVLSFFLPHELQADWNPPAPYEFNLPSALDTKDGEFEIVPAFRPKTVFGKVEFSDDGEGVPDAEVIAQNEESGQRAKVLTDPDGNYELKLRGGAWRIWAQPQDHTAGWYSDPEDEAWVEFDEDDEEETDEINLEVHRISQDDFVEIVGQIVSSDNSPLPNNVVSVELCDDFGLCFGSPVPPAGNFQFYVLPGFYIASVQVKPGSGLVPPQDNHEDVYAFDDVDLGTLVLRSRTAADAGRLTGRVIISATGQGLSGVEINAFSDNDFATTETYTNGQYAVNLFPGFWDAGPELTEAQEDEYLILPPAQRHGLLASGEVISNVNFFLVKRDAIIKGNIVESGTTTPVTDLNAVAYAERCNDNNRCHIVDESDVLADGSFELNVIGGPNQSYTVGVWILDRDYISGDGETVSVTAGETVTDVNVEVIPAGTRIFGKLEDGNTGQPVVIEATIYASDEAGNYWVEDKLWPEKTPYEYEVFVPTPTTNPVSWTIGVWVDPSTGYIVDPASPAVNKIVQPNATSISADLTVVQLTDFVSGTVHAANVPIPYAYVFVEGLEDTDQEGLFFEGQADKDGNFSIPVLPGEYEVGAFLPPDRVDTLLPPVLQTWSSNADNPINIAFRERTTGAGALTISGSLSLAENQRDTDNQVVIIIVGLVAWSPEYGFVDITGNTDTGYELPVEPNSTWHIWAYYEDLENNAYYESNVTQFNVTDSSITNADIVLTKADFELPDTVCESFDSTRFQRIILPSRSDLPEPLMEIQPNTIPATGTVKICATPKVGVREGHNVVGFAYELAAYDSSGTIIEENFDKDVRLIFYLTQNAIPAGSTISDLEFGFFSTARQEWQGLTDVFIDETDLFVTGKLNHFSTWAMRVPTSTGDEYLYMPVILR
ncbi:MAG: carboxypeptidase-like regulatory domain-containing protein, partial [Chloroflexota bacterium]